MSGGGEPKFKPKLGKKKGKGRLKKGSSTNHPDLLALAQKSAKRQAARAQGGRGRGRGRGGGRGGMAAGGRVGVGGASSSSSSSSSYARGSSSSSSRALSSSSKAAAAAVVVAKAEAAAGDSEDDELERELAENEARAVAEEFDDEHGGPVRVPFPNLSADNTEEQNDRIREQQLQTPFFVQLPSRLPFRVGPDVDMVPRVATSLKDLPAGYIGRLRFHKSGKVTLKLGNLVLDVSKGTECLSMQELVSHGGDSTEAYRLGNVNMRLNVTL